MKNVENLYVENIDFENFPMIKFENCDNIIFNNCLLPILKTTELCSEIAVISRF